MFGGHIPILLIYLQVSSGGCDLLCPTINELNTTAELTCFTQINTAGHAYSRSSSGAIVATCTAPGTPCFIFQNGYSAQFVNSTHTVLTVISVTTSDAGSWTCTISGMTQDLCDMEVMKTRTCSITSKEDTDVLAQYQQLTLTVDIQDYYCSTALTFSLQTGNVTTLLMEADSVASVTHNTSSVTLNVTDSYLGVVGLMFKCHNNKWNLPCDGVTELIPKTPTCNITGDKDTKTLTLNEELTLTVDIAAYYDIRGSYCSVESNFTLQTGDVTQLLNVAGTGADHYLSPITFNVTETYLGGVRLIFNCKHKHWNLTCVGVGELSKKTKTAAVPENDELVTASTPIIASCVVGAIVCFIIVVIIIVFVVKRKQGKRKVAAGYPSSDETEHQVEDNVVLPNGSVSGTSQQEPGLRINPVYIPAAVVDSLMTTATTGTSTETDGDHLHPETRGEYDALDRNAVQPSNIYEYLTTYEQIANM